jgi:integrase
MGSVQRVNRPKPWLARYRAPDGRQHSKTFHRKIDAEKWLRAEESAADRGAWVDPKGGSILYQEWAERWFAGLVDLKPKTHAGYRWLLDSRVLPTFGHLPLRSITTAAVRGWMSEMAEEGFSASGIRQARQVLHASLKQAVDDGVIVTNPVERVKPPTVRPRRQRFLTADELAKLADSADAVQPGAGAVVWFLGWSGLRWGEMVALRHRSIDGRRVHIREAVTEVRGRIMFGTPKTHEERTVVVPDFVVERLPPGGKSDELVFTAPRGGVLRSSNFRNKIWIPAVEASGLAPLIIHDLRDTAASLAISAGASIKAVQRMLGHASAAMTLDVYGGLFTEDLEELADRLQEKYR